MDISLRTFWRWLASTCLGISGRCRMICFGVTVCQPKHIATMQKRASFAYVHLKVCTLIRRVADCFDLWFDSYCACMRFFLNNKGLLLCVFLRGEHLRVQLPYYLFHLHVMCGMETHSSWLWHEYE